MLPRTTFGLVSSAVPLSATTPAAPSPSAVRRIVPTLPGSCTASSTSDRSTRRRPGYPSVVQRRGSTTATTPWGCSVSASASSSPSLTGSTRTARRSSALLRALPAGSSFQRGRDGGAAERQPGGERLFHQPHALRRAPVRGARGRDAGAGRGSWSAEGSSWPCSSHEDRAHDRGLGLRRRRRHPGRPQDLPAVRRLRHLGHRRPHRAEHARRPAVETGLRGHGRRAARRPGRGPAARRRSRPACSPTSSLVRLVAKAIRENGWSPLVVDPVMVSTSGHRLLDAGGRGRRPREPASARRPGHAQPRRGRHPHRPRRARRGRHGACRRDAPPLRRRAPRW